MEGPYRRESDDRGQVSSYGHRHVESPWKQSLNLQCVSKSEHLVNVFERCHQLALASNDRGLLQGC